jgi:hypothetical protein
MELVAALACTPPKSYDSGSRTIVLASADHVSSLTTSSFFSKVSGERQSLFFYHFLFSSQLFDITRRVMVGNNSARTAVQVVRVGQPYFGREASAPWGHSIYWSGKGLRGIVRSWQGLCEHVYSQWTDCLVHWGEEKRTRVI